MKNENVLFESKTKDKLNYFSKELNNYDLLSYFNMSQGSKITINSQRSKEYKLNLENLNINLRIPKHYYNTL